VITFSVGREDLAACHLQVDLVDSQYCPIRQLLTDHLAQGVSQCCLYPGWKHGNQHPMTHLDLLAEDIEGMFSEYDEPQDGDPTHTAASLTPNCNAWTLIPEEDLTEHMRSLTNSA
jgi:hypothetical protein